MHGAAIKGVARAGRQASPDARWRGPAAARPPQTPTRAAPASSSRYGPLRCDEPTGDRIPRSARTRQVQTFRIERRRTVELLARVGSGPQFEAALEADPPALREADRPAHVRHDALVLLEVLPRPRVQRQPHRRRAPAVDLRTLAHREAGQPPMG